MHGKIRYRDIQAYIIYYTKISLYNLAVHAQNISTDYSSVIKVSSNHCYKGKSSRLKIRTLGLRISLALKPLGKSLRLSEFQVCFDTEV